MADNQRDGHETPFGRLIREAKEEAFHARRALRREQPNPSLETKRELANALADYQDVLEDYDGERALEIPWQERLPVDLDALLEDTVEVPEAVPSRNRHATNDRTMPAVVSLSSTQLLHVGKVLDSIAKELGFAASAKQPTPPEESSPSDLRGLLKARGQTEALENLPDHFENAPGNKDDPEEAVADGGTEE